jgi:hypothetical protein
MTGDFLKTLQINENQNLTSKYLNHLMYMKAIYHHLKRQDLKGS